MQRSFDPFKLVLGVLSVILSYFVLTRPDVSAVTVLLLAGIFMIVDGILRLAGRGSLRRSGMGSTGLLTFGAILDIIVGILMIVMPSFGMTFLWIFLSIGVIFDSFFELWAARFIKDSKGYYWFVVVLAILGILIGIAMLFSPTFAVSFAVALLGAYFLVFGIMDIVSSF